MLTAVWYAYWSCAASFIEPIRMQKNAARRCTSAGKFASSDPGQKHPPKYEVQKQNYNTKVVREKGKTELNK